jgi:hypothetical protein
MAPAVLQLKTVEAELPSDFQHHIALTPWERCKRGTLTKTLPRNAAMRIWLRPDIIVASKVLLAYS